MLNYYLSSTKTVIIMSTLLLSILGISMSIPQCPMWKEIQPCTCRMDTKLITVQCDIMQSFDQIVNILKGHFTPADRVSLRISYSKLEDLNFRYFKELNMTIENLKLNHDNLGELNPETFEGLTKVNYFSLADNVLDRVPEDLWKYMPGIKTIDLGRTRIKELKTTSFHDLPLPCLILAGNMISRMDSDTFPVHLQRLHIGRNNIKHLNKTLINLNDLVWLFGNSNELTDIEGELPSNAKNLKFIHLSYNNLEHLPTQLRSLTSLDTLFLQHNRIKSLDGVLGMSKKLLRLFLDNNLIDILTPEDFAETETLESLILGSNRIKSLNNSLLNLKNLHFLNISDNLLTEFSFQEITGLQKLTSINLSYNKIKTLYGSPANLVEWNTKLAEIKLDHNELETLNGALSGLPQLLHLNLSFNRLIKICPDDFIGLDQLKVLDLSHNYLTTLEETGRTVLPRLEQLIASHNLLTILDKDFHGLPNLCLADLSHNQIIALGRDLVAKTRCKIGHGIHEGAWDTLKIDLQDNPILCDAALPEISSTMEINHTRITGVAHCGPLSEQPVTSKPNGFLGYIPETTSSLPALLSGQNVFQKPGTTYLVPQDQLADLNKNEQYGVENNINILASNESAVVIDPVKQEKQLTKLATELEALRTRVEELASQNQILLSHTNLTTNKSLTTATIASDEQRKP